MNRLNAVQNGIGPQELIRGLVQGGQQRGGIRCVSLYRLDRKFFDALRNEVAMFCHEHAPSIVSDAQHVTNWACPSGRVLQYSLLNQTGIAANFGVDHNLSCQDKWFFDSGTFPCLGRFIEDLPHLFNFRINVLTGGAELAAHKEHVPFRTRTGLIGARLRFHLPVMTTPMAEINLNGEVFHLERGAIYLVNQGCIHWARNQDQHDRIHLLWDAMLTKSLVQFVQGSSFPDYLTPSAIRFPECSRREAIGPFRRLPCDMTDTEAARMQVCDPQ